MALGQKENPTLGGRQVAVGSIFPLTNRVSFLDTKKKPYICLLALFFWGGSIFLIFFDVFLFFQLKSLLQIFEARMRDLERRPRWR